MACVGCKKNHAEDALKGKFLVEAARKGDYRKVLQLLKCGVSVNAEDYRRGLYFTSENFFTPVQEACAGGHLACLEILIEHGADLNAKDRHDLTALHMAAERGDRECLNILLESGADISVATECNKKIKRPRSSFFPSLGPTTYASGTTPLHIATLKGNTSCIEELIKFGADYNAVDDKGRTSLYIAAEKGLEDAIMAHLQNAIGREILSLPSLESGDTPLHFCITNGFVECVEALLDHGSDVNLRNNAGYSSLDYGVLFNSKNDNLALKILKLLITKGYNCDVNIRNNGGFTALKYACFDDGVQLRKKPAVAALLIAYGATIKFSDQNCHSLIYMEMWSESTDMTVLKAIVNSTRHLPSLHSLNLLPPSSSNQSLEIGPIPPPLPKVIFEPDLEHFFPLCGLQNKLSSLNPNAAVIVQSFPAVGNDQLDFMEYRRNWILHRLQLREVNNSDIIKSTAYEVKYNWYKEIASQPRTLQHNCRCQIRSSLGYKRLKYIADLLIPISLRQYLLLEGNE